MASLTSFEVLPPQSSSDQTEESPEFSASPNPSLSHLSGSFNMLNMRSAVMSATPDLSSEEVHLWLKELLKENIEMKETLHRNNLLMHEQYRTVAAWHEQMVQSNSNNQSMLELTNKLNKKLQSEKQELLKKIEELENKIKTSPESESCLKCNLLEEKLANLNETKYENEKLSCELQEQRGLFKLLQKGMQDISQDLDHLKSANKVLTNEKQELTALNNDLITQLSYLNIAERKENMATVVTDEESGYAIVFHPEKPVTNTRESLKGTLLQLKEEQKELIQLSQKLENEQMEVACLKNMLLEKEEQIIALTKMTEPAKGGVEKSECENSILCSSCRGEIGITQQQSPEVLQENLVDISCLEKYKEKCDNLQKCILEYEDKLVQQQSSATRNMEQLQEKIKDLQNAAMHERQKNEQEKKSLSVTALALERISLDYEKAVKQLTSYQQQERTQGYQESTMKENEQRQHYEELDTLTARFIEMEEQLEASKKNVAKLKKELSSVNEASENIPILKAQVDLYKTDFESEKLAKLLLETEVEKLRKELKHLQEQLGSLQESQATHHGSTGRHHKSFSIDTKMRKAKHHSSTPRKHGISTVPSAPDVPSLFSCPNCSLMFTELQVLENHVEECIFHNDGYL